MFKPALASIAGYFAMVLILRTLLSPLYSAMGMPRTFQPDSFEPTLLWVGGMLLVSLAAAVIGGAVATRIGGRAGLRGLFGLILALGYLAIPVQAKYQAPSGPRLPEVAAAEAFGHMRVPLWVSLVLPLLGVAGAAHGAKRGMRSRAAASPNAT